MPGSAGCFVISGLLGDRSTPSFRSGACRGTASGSLTAPAAFAVPEVAMPTRETFFPTVSEAVCPGTSTTLCAPTTGWSPRSHTTSSQRISRKRATTTFFKPWAFRRVASIPTASSRARGVCAIPAFGTRCCAPTSRNAPFARSTSASAAERWRSTPPTSSGAKRVVPTTSGTESPSAYSTTSFSTKAPSRCRPPTTAASSSYRNPPTAPRASTNGSAASTVEPFANRFETAIVPAIDSSPGTFAKSFNLPNGHDRLPPRPRRLGDSRLGVVHAIRAGAPDPGGLAPDGGLA